MFNRALLFGKWFRQDTDDSGEKIVEYATLNNDGCFEFNFSTYDQQGNLTSENIELGDWGLVGDIHFTITKNEVVDEELYQADLTDGLNYHAYKVLTLDHHCFEYQHVESKETFLMYKITDVVAYC